MRSAARPRREVPSAVLTALTPLFRYSTPRDAYVLRGVGRNVGPVLRKRPSGRFVREEDAPTGRFHRDGS
jgi:hypothetical protein